jgi:hypothetical protein
MKSIKHTIKLETVVDEKSVVGMQLLAISAEKRNAILNEMVNDLLAPRIQPILDELNENGSYAILKLVQK